MITIKLVDARRGLNQKCRELFSDAKIADQIYAYLCDGIEECDYAEPERKRGKWIPHIEKTREYIGTVLVNVEYGYWFCDICSYRVENGQPMYNFCPNCGADMRGEQND